MDENGSTSAEPVRIKKYANRRLYNTATSTYVTLDDLAEMVKKGSDFVVSDAKSGEDITRSVLTQIIFEQETKGQNLLPIPFLRQLIRFYGDSLQTMVPSYLEVSLAQLAREQSRFRQHIADAFGASPVDLIEEQVKKNISMFNDAMKMFAPFATAARTGTSQPEDASQPASGRGGATRDDDIAALKDQLQVMQAQLEKLARNRRDDD